MKAVILILVLLAVVAVIAAGLHPWHDKGEVKADYQPAPAFTAEDKFFVQRAHDLIKTAISLDREAELRGRFPSTQSFARQDELGQQQRLEDLEKALAAVDPEFNFQSVQAAKPKNPAADRNFDTHYLQDMIQLDNRMLSLIEDSSSIEDNPPLARFGDTWQSYVNSRLEAARSVLADGKRVD